MSRDVRGPQVDAVVRAVVAGRSVVLQGDEGSGRTSICRSVVDRLGESGTRAVTVSGAETVDGVPFAAVAPLVTRFELADAEPLTLLSMLPRRLASAGTVVVVDDAERLDPASHVLLSQVHRAGCPMVLATTHVDRLPRNLRDVVAGSAWETHTVPPLDADDVLALAAAVAGEELDAESAARVVAMGRGNPARTVAFVEACARAAEVGPGGITLGPLQPTAAVQRLVGEVPAGPGRDLVGVLAAAGPLPEAVLDHGAELHGPHVLVDDGRLRLRDALVGAVVLAGATDDERRRWCATAVRWLDGLPAEVGRRTLLCRRAGLATSVGDRVEAAGRAQRDGHDAEAVELLDGLPSTGEVQLLRGAAWSGMGATTWRARPWIRCSTATTTSASRRRCTRSASCSRCGWPSLPQRWRSSRGTCPDSDPLIEPASRPSCSSGGSWPGYRSATPAGRWSLRARASPAL